MSSPPSLTVADLAGAERVAAVESTDAERAQMLAQVAKQAALVIGRRSVPLPHTLGPALRFDPRLPGFEMPANCGPSRSMRSPLPLPRADVDIAFASVETLAGWIRTGQLTSRRLTELYLARIAAHDAQLLAFACVARDVALAQADACDALLAAGTYLGPLHGIPYGCKDLADTAGIETAWGAAPYRGRVPDEDAHAVAALRDAGAVLLGKTSVGELAWSDTWYAGQTRNPWNPAEGSSGSSAGSAAAVAAGLCAFALATETLGSIVSPSKRCGTAGLRPTYGRVSRRGVMPLCWSMDKIGAIARSAPDTALVIAAMAAPDPLDAYQIVLPYLPTPALPVSKPLAGWKVGFYPAQMDAEAARSADSADLDRGALGMVEALGAALVPLTRPVLPYANLGAIIDAEAGAALDDLVLSGRDSDLVVQGDDGYPTRLRAARLLSAVEHVQLDRLRRRVMLDMDAVFASVDAVVGSANDSDMTTITNVTGHPCVSVPIAYRLSGTRTSSSGDTVAGSPPTRVPHNVSLWGRLYDEGRLVAAAAALEEAFKATERPPLFS